MNLVIDCNVNCYNETNVGEVSTDLSLIWLYYSYLHVSGIYFRFKRFENKAATVNKNKVYRKKLLTNKRQNNDSKNNMGICG